MMPSRGIHVLRGRLPRTYQQHCRNLSSTSTRPIVFRTASTTSSPLSRTTIPFPRSTRIAIPSIAALRYASTQPATPAPPTTPVSDTTSSLSNIDTITLDEVGKNVIVDPNAIPEQIGYLHAIGVDYGYGPTSMIQWLLEHAHISGGLPWWAAIVFTAATLRVIMLPLYLNMSDTQARTAALAPVLKPFNEKLVEEQRKGNTAGALYVYQQIGMIKKRAGIKNWKIIAPMIAQGVLGYCGFKLTRYLATLPVPGFKDGGFLWLQDLSMTDGYLLLPLMMAGTIHLVIRMGGESGAAGAMAPAMRKFMMYGMPALIFLITSWQPGAVALWFLGSGIVGVPQSLLLQRPAVRKYFGLAPLYVLKPEDRAPGIMDSLFQKELEKRAPSSSHAADKNAAYMRPNYQAPNIRTNRPVIDAKLVDKSDMVQASAPAKSIFDQAKEKFQAGRDTDKKLSQRSPSPVKDSQRAEYKRRADEYEKRARGGSSR